VIADIEIDSPLSLVAMADDFALNPSSTVLSSESGKQTQKGLMQHRKMFLLAVDYLLPWYSIRKWRGTQACIRKYSKGLAFTTSCPCIRASHTVPERCGI
jgi:hypothetical protein